VSLAEGAKTSRLNFGRCRKIVGFATSFRGDDNPALLYRVVAKFRHISIAGWIHYFLAEQPGF
jgi:hypothetical protein